MILISFLIFYEGEFAMKCYLCYRDINDDYYYQSNYKDMTLHFHISCLPNFTIKSIKKNDSKLPVCQICGDELNFNNINTLRNSEHILKYFCNTCFKTSKKLHILFTIIEKVDDITKNNSIKNVCIFCNNIDNIKNLQEYITSEGTKWYYHERCIDE